jgi:hypothetical protein
MISWKQIQHLPKPWSSENDWITREGRRLAFLLRRLDRKLLLRMAAIISQGATTESKDTCRRFLRELKIAQRP